MGLVETDIESGWQLVDWSSTPRPPSVECLLTGGVGLAGGKRWAALMGVATETIRVAAVLRLLRRQLPDRTAQATALGKDVIQRTLANAARTGANPASVMQSENDNVPALRRP